MTAAQSREVEPLSFCLKALSFRSARPHGMEDKSVVDIDNAAGFLVVGLIILTLFRSGS